MNTDRIDYFYLRDIYLKFDFEKKILNYVSNKQSINKHDFIEKIEYESELKAFHITAEYFMLKTFDEFIEFIEKYDLIVWRYEYKNNN